MTESELELSFSTKKFVLQGVLEKAAQVLPTRDIVPVLKNVQVEVVPDGDSPGELRVVATDMQMAVIARTQMVEIAQPGKVVFPGQRFATIVREAPPEVLSVEVADGFADINVGRNHWRLRLMDGTEYPPLTAVEAQVGEHFIEIDRVKLLSAFRAVRYAASSDQARPQLTLLDVNDQRMRAADGIRFQQVDMPWWPKGLDVQFAARAVDDLVKLLKTTEAPTIELGVTDDNIALRVASDTFIITRSTYDFPDLDKQLLKPSLGNDKLLSVDREEFEHAIKRVRVTADPETSAVVLRLVDGEMTVASKDKYGNLATEIVDVGWDSGKHEVAFHHGFLADMLASASSKTCTFYLGADTKTRKSPILLRDEEEGTMGVLNQIRVDYL